MGAMFLMRAGSPTRRLIAIVALASTLVFAMVVIAVLEMRWDAIDAATNQAADVASVLADDVANSISTVDVTLRDAVDISQSLVSASSIREPEANAIRQALRQRRRAMDRSEMIAVTNENGDVVSAASDFAPTRINVSDREYFTAIRDDRSRGLYVSKPLTSKLTGTTTIFFARRIETSTGLFLGIAFVGIEPPSLFRSLEGMNTPGERSFSLLYFDGVVAWREPFIDGIVGRPIPELAMWQEVARRGGGSYHADGIFDPYPKYFATRRVGAGPFFVSVGVADAFALATWRTRATTIVLGSVGAAIVVIALLGSLSTRARRLLDKERELAGTRERFGLALDYMSQGMAMFDGNDKLLMANRGYSELYDVSPEVVHPGMDAEEVYALRVASGAYVGNSPEDYKKRLYSRPRVDRVDELRNGRIIQVRLKEIDDGAWVTVQEDVTERTLATRKLIHAARHDNLTHLHNRREFADQLASRLRASSALGFAILLIDIDRFKDVNDIYGHEVGDAVLIEVAKRFSGEAGDRFLARLGGNQFVAMTASGDVDPDNALALATRFIAVAQDPIEIDGRQIRLGLRVGFKIVNPASTDAVSVMRRVDLALYAAKSMGRNSIKRFDAEMERDYELRAILASDLRDAIDQGRLEVHYQPIVDAADDRPVCMEALARWRHPTRGMISPAIFIPLAEEIGMINAIGAWVLRRACADAARWRSDILVAVNASALQVETSDFVDVVTAALVDAKLPPHRLQIEITETIVLRKDEAICDQLNRLRAIGVTFALDDFGTGFASLSYLKAFPLDKIKIDKSFVDDVCVSSQALTIVGAIVALARGLGVATTAEGVETKEQGDILRAIGVTTMQGYYFGKPKPNGEHPAITLSADGVVGDLAVRAA
jgi:diguanylate cyclase (GGDEF)-like protein